MEPCEIRHSTLCVVALMGMFVSKGYKKWIEPGKHAPRIADELQGFAAPCAGLSALTLPARATGILTAALRLLVLFVRLAQVLCPLATSRAH